MKPRAPLSVLDEMLNSMVPSAVVTRPPVLWARSEVWTGAAADARPGNESATMAAATRSVVIRRRRVHGEDGVDGMTNMRFLRMFEVVLPTGSARKTGFGCSADAPPSAKV